MNSLRNNFSQKKEYVVPDCRVHQFAYELMGIDVTSPPTEIGGRGPTSSTEVPSVDEDDAKGYTFSFNVWEDGNL